MVLANTFYLQYIDKEREKSKQFIFPTLRKTNVKDRSLGIDFQTHSSIHSTNVYEQYVAGKNTPSPCLFQILQSRRGDRRGSSKHKKKCNVSGELSAESKGPIRKTKKKKKEKTKKA